jgi:hypothetical protein
MIKREIFELLKKIAVFYDQFVVNQEKVNMWHEVLRGFSFEAVQENLLSFVKESAYPPKLFDLVQESPNTSTIPNPEETKKIITPNLVPAREIVVQKELEKMRAILGIVRG